MKNKSNFDTERKFTNPTINLQGLSTQSDRFRYFTCCKLSSLTKYNRNDRNIGSSYLPFTQINCSLTYRSFVNFRLCAICGTFCLKFHKWMVSSAVADIKEPSLTRNWRWRTAALPGGPSMSWRTCISTPGWPNLVIVCQGKLMTWHARTWCTLYWKCVVLLW